MRKTSLLFLFISTFILTSCDPTHRIDFVNNVESNTKVKLVMNSNIENPYLDEYRKGDSIILNLKPIGNEENEAEIPFARGFLNEYRINEIAKSIKSIEIDNSNIKVIYKSSSAIKNLLLKNQKGFIFKTSININIDDDFAN